MTSNFYFNEQMVKDIERQLMAEADKLRLIKANKPDKTKNRKSISSSMPKFIKGLRALSFRKQKPAICRCPHG